MIVVFLTEIHISKLTVINPFDVVHLALYLKIVFHVEIKSKTNLFSLLMYVNLICQKTKTTTINSLEKKKTKQTTITHRHTCKRKRINVLLLLNTKKKIYIYIMRFIFFSMYQKLDCIKEYIHLQVNHLDNNF